MPLYEVAILETPTKKEQEEGTREERLAFGPKCVIAADPQSAAVKAVMENTTDVADIDRARMQILVRPFA